MTTYNVIVEDNGKIFQHTFDGEPQINLTFEAEGAVYKVTTRAHDESDPESPTLHARII